MRQEKIGSSNYFWSFPSEASVKIESELSQIEASIEEVAGKRTDLERQIKQARIGKEESEIRSIKMKELGGIEEAIRACDSELAKFKEVKVPYNVMSIISLFQRLIID